MTYPSKRFFSQDSMFSQKVLITFLSLATLLLSIPRLSAQERTKLYVGTSAIHSPTLFPLYVAEQKGMFREQGFDIAPVYMVPRVQIPALTAKEIPYVTGLGSVLSGAARGLPVKLVMVFMAHSPQVLVARSQIRSVGELRGRSVGVTQSGATEHRFLLLILKKYGIDPQDVKVVSLRETPNRIMAVKEGIVDAAVLDVFSGLQMEKEGYKQLVFVKDITELPATGLATHEDRIREKRTEVKRMLTAILRANAYIKSRAGDLPGLMKQYMHLPAVDTARTAFEAYRGLWSENGLTSAEGLRNVASLGGVGENTPLDKLADWSILKEVLASQKTP
jgi:ABC-type nitrate/sulfonate/bicarbonate transport system substrate-binding protein